MLCVVCYKAPLLDTGKKQLTLAAGAVYNASNFPPHAQVDMCSIVCYTHRLTHALGLCYASSVRFTVGPAVTRVKKKRSILLLRFVLLTKQLVAAC